MDNELEMNPQSEQDQFDKDIAEDALNRNDWMSPDEFGNYLKEELKRMYSHINVDIRNGDFSSFDRLNESQKGVVAKDWDKNMRMEYLNRHAHMSEEEFYAQLDKIANGTFQE